MTIILAFSKSGFFDESLSINREKLTLLLPMLVSILAVSLSVLFTYFYLFINKDGSFSKRGTLRFPNKNEAVPGTYAWVDINPPDTRFILADEEVVDAQAGFTNFEIIYTGKNSQ